MLHGEYILSTPMLVLSTHIAVKFQPPYAMEICINFGSKVHRYSVIYLLFVLEGAGYEKMMAEVQG